MEKTFIKLTATSKFRLRVTPGILREAADRLEYELKNNTLSNQEAEVAFSPSLTLFAEREPVTPRYPSISSDDKARIQASLEADPEDNTEQGVVSEVTVLN